MEIRKASKVVLTVRDNGIGIEPDLLPYIFEVFRQSRQTLDRAQGGLGLGLALVKTLVDMHNGTIEVQSSGENEGATFTVKLPITSKNPTKSSARTVAPVTSSTVLLIEDNEDSAEALRELLVFLGYRVHVARHGQQGIDEARAHRPDIILCDIGLPGELSGFEVAKLLRSNKETATIRLIAITGYGRPEDERRSEEAGFDEHLTKPVDLDRLTSVLKSFR
jgi:CheY-like chemotaxis protein